MEAAEPDHSYPRLWGLSWAGGSAPSGWPLLMDAFSSGPGPGSSVVHSGPNLHHLAYPKAFPFLQTVICGDPEEFGYFEDFGPLVVCVLVEGANRLDRISWT